MRPEELRAESGATRREHDDGDADQADERTGDIPSVGPESIECHAPGEGSGDEDATVSGEDSAEVRVGFRSQPGHGTTFTTRLPTAQLIDAANLEQAT